MLFWYQVGWTADRRARGRAGAGSVVTLVGLTSGAVFGILLAVYADAMAASNHTPDRNIGAFGFAWAVAVTAYFTLRLARVAGICGASPR